MESIVLIQARLSSNRLPAKVLLPIGNMPLVVLVARRAGNTGKKVLVVTSNQSSDDLLCNCLEEHGIDFFRGDLNNVLHRFISATTKMHDSSIVFRLTADNVFPDGELIDELEQEFISNNDEYLACNGHKSGLPYGLSVEVMRLGKLRQANDNTELDYDLEHVTPYIIRHSKVSYFRKYSNMELGNYRCTIDNFEDYLSVSKVFSLIKNPEHIAWKELSSVLVENSQYKIFNKSAEKMVVGGAQFGLDYGISNELGKPDAQTVDSIINTAINNGVTCIDTAKDYGDSEKRIGEVITHSGLRSRVKIVTKLSSLSNCPNNTNLKTIRTFVRESVYGSCVNFGVEKIDYLMLHRGSHLIKWGGCVWDELLRLKKLGVIDKLGISVQDQDELKRALDVDDIDIIQMPYNAVDRRWDDYINKIRSVQAQRGLIVHVRSVFLQGLLLTKKDDLWTRANVNQPTLVIKWLEDCVKRFNRLSVSDFCLAYARSLDWADGVIVGMNTIEQLHENLAYFNQPLLSQNEILDINSTAPKLNVETLNPSNWKRSC
jgi:spore coat polysaccharide biosynthesis protein SpsF